MFKEINYSEYKKLNLEVYYKIGNSPYCKCSTYFEDNCYKGFIVYSLIYDRIEI